MEIYYNERLVHLYFSKTVKTKARDETLNENEISDEELKRIRDDKSFWNFFIPQYLTDRNLSLTTEWFDQQQDRENTRYASYNSELIVNIDSIYDMATRIDMTTFPNYFGKIRVFSINTVITRSGPVEITFFLHKDA